MSVNEYIAGAIGGAAGVIVGHPFDTTKIQMQIRTSGDHKIMKTSHAWASVRAQGFKRGIFRGMMFPAVSYGITNAVFFGVYGHTLELLAPEAITKPTSFQVYTAGCVAGCAQLVLSCPVEVIKCTMQSQIPLSLPQETTGIFAQHEGATLKPAKYHRGPLHCYRDIMKHEGPKGFYKGFLTMFLRDVPGFGVYLLVYESLFKIIVNNKMSDDKGVLAAVVAGGIAGCLSWLIVMPFDVIKSRLQVDHGQRFKGFWDCAVTSVRKGGYGVLFRGTGMTLARAFPVNAVTFLVYSQLLNKFNAINPRVTEAPPPDTTNTEQITDKDQMTNDGHSSAQIDEKPPDKQA